MPEAARILFQDRVAKLHYMVSSFDAKIKNPTDQMY
jgi:hypothetical protein